MFKKLTIIALGFLFFASIANAEENNTNPAPSEKGVFVCTVKDSSGKAYYGRGKSAAKNAINSCAKSTGMGCRVTSCRFRGGQGRW